MRWLDRPLTHGHLLGYAIGTVIGRIIAEVLL